MALVPAAAHAAHAELSGDGTELRVDSGVNEASNLVVSFDGSRYVVEDLNGAEVNGGRDCPELGKKARCEGGFTRVKVDLGAQADKFDLKIDRAATVDGGTGNDQIFTLDSADKVNGGFGNDQITTRGGADKIDGGGDKDAVAAGAGNDEVEGGSDDDTLNGGSGNDDMTGGLFSYAAFLTGVGGADTLDGGADQDSFESDPGPDDYRGGPGGDFMGYNRITTHATVTLDDLPNDGRGAENDNVHADVEIVSGGNLGDNLTGSVGDDTLNGNSGADNLDGRAGEDFFQGDSGNDVINAREDPPTPFEDFVRCGVGVDSAFLDLTDTLDSSADELCETVERAPVGQGPNVRIARKRIKVSRSGRVRIPLSCPRAQHNGCKGTLALSGSKGKARFNLSPGQKTVARRRLARKHRRRLRQRRRGIRLKAVARERDPSGRPKTTSTIFRLRLRRS